MELIAGELKNNRLRELDFLRGIAIILVLLRHTHLNEYATTMGWIGVDLFFVLSGFLVSGLLFKEYNRFGTIDTKLFLIRRGFKIYPIYYLAIAGYCIPIILYGRLYWIGLIGELFFLQNYVTAYGYTFLASWSLAVEEHFYLVLVLMFGWLIKKKWLNLSTYTSNWTKDKVILYLLSIMLICLGLRIISNIYFPVRRNFTMTHLRIDSLVAGVLISYIYHFRFSSLQEWFCRNSKWVLPISIILLSFSPFVKDSTYSFFVKTIGFSLLYISFGLLLIYFLLKKNINELLNALLSKYVVGFISATGVYSYSIYISHTLVVEFFNKQFQDSPYISFLLGFFTSILLGKLISDTIEKWFLKLRDKYYPSRIITS